MKDLIDLFFYVSDLWVASPATATTQQFIAEPYCVEYNFSTVPHKVTGLHVYRLGRVTNEGRRQHCVFGIARCAKIVVMGGRYRGNYRNREWLITTMEQLSLLPEILEIIENGLLKALAAHNELFVGPSAVVQNWQE